MRLKSLEITDLAEIVDVLQRCPTIRLGILDGDCPYTVPVSFGYEVDGDAITVYFHGADAGKKLELLQKNPIICVEADIFHGYAVTEHGLVTRYESVIGSGTAQKIEGAEKIKGLQLICDHCGFSEFPVELCKSLDRTAAYRITLDQITGKRNLPKREASK